MSTQLVEVYLGNEIDDRNERQVLRRLRADLDRRGIRARIYANFIAGPHQRQVDLLIDTPHRLVHAELKVLDQALPLRGGVNGPWAQVLPDGTERSLGHNFCRQAHDATYAISDDMHRLARRGHVPAGAGKFYKDIHTMVLLYPDVPPGSRLALYRHVDVIGYTQLLDLLATDGPRPAWTNDHWAAFARQLGLYREEVEEPTEAARRAQLTVLEDYRVRFAAVHRAGLHELVPVAAHIGARLVSNPVGVLTDAVQAQRTVVLTGQSGAGKSHAARHAALAVADAGGIPVWMRCGEYQSGRFSIALARAVAPFTAESGWGLLQLAADAGHPTVVVLDGLNECAPELRGELLEQLGALRLRLPVAAIVTTSTPARLPTSLSLVEMTADLPDEEARTAVLASYGAEHLPGAEAFQTPYELSLAADCAEDLRPGAGPAELFDVYVSRRCPAETTRGGLRRVAAEMDAQVRRALSVSEVRALLHRAAGSTNADAGIDAVLQSPLLIHSQGRVAFTHEQLARFLAAEELMLGSGDIPTTVAVLRDPRHDDLRQLVVALEHDERRRAELLLAVADVELLHAATRGAFGLATAEAIRSSMTGTLEQAAADTENAELIQAGGPDDGFEVMWRTPAARGPQQQALLAVAGLCLSDGLLVEETARLLDLSDRRCAAEMHRLQEGGHRAATSAVVRATYLRVTFTPDREAVRLPVSVVVAAAWDPFRRHDSERTAARATAMWEATLVGPRWGRLTAALYLVNPASAEDMALLPDLFAAAWKANGYHLRLEALTTVTNLSRLVDPITRQRLREVLQDCDAKNVWLNSLLFEAMAAYDLIEPMNTAEDIQAEIAAVLAAPEEPDAWATAQGIIGRIFEDQALHGPYDQVIGELDEETNLRLHVMAARTDAFPFHRDYVMAMIAARVGAGADDVTRGVLRDAVLTLDWGSPFREESVGAHLIALRGWSRIADGLPTAPAGGGNVARRAWRLFDELLFSLLRGADPSAVERQELWTELIGLCAPAAVDVLAHLRAAQTWEWTGDAGVGLYVQLVDAWPEQTRRLIEWGLSHRDQIVATFDNGPASHGIRGLLKDLGRVGTANTTTLLHTYTSDPDIGAAVVGVIREIEDRNR